MLFRRHRRVLGFTELRENDYVHRGVTRLLKALVVAASRKKCDTDRNRAGLGRSHFGNKLCGCTCTLTASRSCLAQRSTRVMISNAVARQPFSPLG